MSDFRRVDGERVFCHQCSNEWDRAHGGLTCPSCEGEFVEILSPSDVPTLEDIREPSPPSSRTSSPRLPPNLFRDHNPWADAPDPDEPDITTFEFNTGGGGRGTFSFSTRSYVTRGNQSHGPPPPPGFPPFGFGHQQGHPLGGIPRADGTFYPRDPHAAPAPGQMQDLFSMIFQTMQTPPGMQPRPGGADRPPNPFDLLGAILNPGNARHGDAVWSQEAFDRIVEQLAEQNQGSSAPGPASETAIRSLPNKKVDESMMGSDGKAECSICMDNVEVGSDVTVLPCNHWFHRDCVTAWLKEHDTCPHCRKAITNPDEANQQTRSSRRRSSRRASSVASPFGAEGVRGNPMAPDSPSGIREARQHYYGTRETELSNERPRSNRHSSSQSDRHHNSRSSGGNSGGGVSGWIRNRMNMG